RREGRSNQIVAGRTAPGGRVSSLVCPRHKKGTGNTGIVAQTCPTASFAGAEISNLLASLRGRRRTRVKPVVPPTEERYRPECSGQSAEVDETARSWLAPAAARFLPGPLVRDSSRYASRGEPGGFSPVPPAARPPSPNRPAANRVHARTRCLGWESPTRGV